MSPLQALAVVVLAWLAPAGAAGWLRDQAWVTDSAAYLVYQMGLLAVVLAATLVVVGRERLPGTLGLARTPFGCLVWAAAGLALYLPVDLLAHLWPQRQPGVDALELLRGYLAREAAPATLTLSLAVVVVAPLSEELAFRGVLQGSLMRRGLPGWMAVVGPGVLWMLAHSAAQGASGQGSVLVLGLLLGWLRLRCGSVLPGVVLHAGVNAFWLALVRWV